MTWRDILYAANFLLVVTAIISVLKARKYPASSMAWIMAIAGIPGLGLLAYVLAGIDWRKRKLVKMIPEEIFTSHLSKSLGKQEDLVNTMFRSDDPKVRRMARNIHLLTRVAAAPVTADNSVKSYFTGAEKFEDLAQDLELARESIHMEYYIWRSDGLGRRLLEILKRKAAEGVAIRLIFDGLGSFGSISYSYRRALKAAGIEFAYFLGLNLPIARLKINYRNHRKIVVIDGRVAYTGGMNVGTEYITGGRRFPKWRDTHLRIDGPAVSMLQAVFLVDWHNSGRENLLDDENFPIFDKQPTKTGVPVQVAISGPDSQWEGIRLHYLELLNGAREEILIQTPYFIPGEAMELAMIAAALRGVRVILMTVGLPDKRIPLWAGQTYYTPLLNAGVEIYRYYAGFIHAKVIVQDRIIASVGTCNVDLRSFSLDYEVNSVLYSPEIASVHADRFMEDLKDCRQVTIEDMEELSGIAQIRNSAARLLSPLM